MIRINGILFVIFSLLLFNNTVKSQSEKPILHYNVSMPQPKTHRFHMEFLVSGLNKDTILFKMPNWTPGYYQLMSYANCIENITAKDGSGKSISINKVNNNTWSIIGFKGKSFQLIYDVKSERLFVANSFIDSTHAYLSPANNFVYIDGFLKSPVSVKVFQNPLWNRIATGLELKPGKTDEFIAPDFDILYDCPILMGNLEELPSFRVNGIEHRFIGYKIGQFDHKLFMNNLKKVIEAAVAIFGDIPYNQYTFIPIGQGGGGIEHLNNTVISFSGDQLNNESEINSIMNYIGHEYFHHYNIKRIRPFELGPFDYDKENRTTQLWISEGLTVYYEYMITNRAGLFDQKAVLNDFEGIINSVENNPGHLKQSLSQSSYNTWNDGPFGRPGESISCYDKGCLMGLILDLSIRNATQNSKSLDDVMRLIYYKYYKTLNRGFTNAEFQEACELVAGIPLTKEFEYVYTVKDLDYNKYLGYAGLEITETSGNLKKEKRKVNRLESTNTLQSAILKTWLSE